MPANNGEQSRPANCMPYVVHSKFDVKTLQHFLQETGKQCINLETLHVIPVSQRDSQRVILVKVRDVFDLTILKSGKTWKSFRVDEVSLDAGASTAVDGALFLAAQGEAAKPAEDYISKGDILAIENPIVIKSSKPNTLFDIRFSNPSHLFVWKTDLKATDTSNVEAREEVAQTKDPWDVPAARSAGEVYHYFNLKMNAQKLFDKQNNFYAMVTGILRSPTQTQASKTNWHAMYLLVDDSCCPPLLEGSPEYENWKKNLNGEPKDYLLHIFDKSKPEAFPPIRLGDVIRVHRARPEKKKSFGNTVKTDIHQSDTDFRTFSGSNVLIFRRDEAPISTSKSYSLTAEERRLAIKMLVYAEVYKQEKDKIDKVLAFSELSAYTSKTEALVNLCGRVLSVRNVYEGNSLFFAIYFEDGTICPLPLAKLTSDAPNLKDVRKTPSNYPVIKIFVPVAKKELDIKIGMYLLFRGVHLKMTRKEDYEYFRFELRGIMCEMSDTSTFKASLFQRIFDSKKLAVSQAPPEPVCTSADEFAELSPFLLEAAATNQQESVSHVSSPLFLSAEEPVRTDEIMEVNEIMRIVNSSTSFLNSGDPEHECSLPIRTNLDTLVTSTPLKNADKNLRSTTSSHDVLNRNLAMEITLHRGTEFESSQGRASVSQACGQINGITPKSQTQACSSITNSDNARYATPSLQSCEGLLGTVPLPPSPARQQIQEVCSSDRPAVKQQQGNVPSGREVAYAQVVNSNEIILNSSAETEGRNQDEIILDSESQTTSSTTHGNGLGMVSLPSTNSVMLKRKSSENVSQENVNSNDSEPEYCLPIITHVDSLATSTPMKNADRNLSSSITSSQDILSRNLEMELTFELSAETEFPRRASSASQTCRQLDGIISKPQTHTCSSTTDSDNTPYATSNLQPCEVLLRTDSSLPSIARQQIQEVCCSDLLAVRQEQGNVQPRREVAYTQMVNENEVILNYSAETEGRNPDEIMLDSESQATPSTNREDGLRMVQLRSANPVTLKRASSEQDFEKSVKKISVERRSQASQSVHIERKDVREICNGTEEIQGDICKAELKTLVAIKAQVEVIESIRELKRGQKKAKILEVTMDENLCKFDVDAVLSNWVFGLCCRCSVAYPYADFLTFPVTDYWQTDYVPQYDGNILKEITVNNFRGSRVNVKDAARTSRKYRCKSYHCPNCILAKVDFDESYLVLSYTTTLKLQDVRGETAELFLSGHAADFFWGVPAIAFMHKKDSQKKLISNVRKLSGQRIRVQIQMLTGAAGQREFHVVGTRNEF